MKTIYQFFLEEDVVLLEQALNLPLPKGKFTVYQLHIGGKSYVGFTSKNINLRLERHLTAAKNGSRLPVHSALRRFGFLCEIEELGTYDNEVLALVEEIKAIEKLKPEFNSSIGGEGKNFRIYDKIDFSGEKRLAVEYLAVRDEKNKLAFIERQKKLKKSKQYLSKVIEKISTRYRKLEKDVDAHIIKILPQPDKPALMTEQKREEVSDYAKCLSLRHKTATSMDEESFAYHSFIYDWQMEFTDAEKLTETRLASEKTVQEKFKINSTSHLKLKRLVTVKKIPTEIRKKITRLSKQPNSLQETKWFYDACKRRIFQSGDGIIFQTITKEPPTGDQNSPKKSNKINIIPVNKALRDTRETIYWVDLFDDFFDNYEMPSDEYIYVEKGYSQSDYSFLANLQVSKNELSVQETGDTLIEIKIDFYQCLIEAKSLYFKKSQTYFYESDVAAEKYLRRCINSSIRKRNELK